MNKYLTIIVGSILITACGVQNNVSFSTQAGSCADGTDNAPYCMAVTIQNNESGQNYISSSTFPFSNLSITVAGPSNVGYPAAAGSSNDPNKCLGSNINPGSSCTFYLQLTGESSAVGTKVPVVITANYTINSQLFGTSSVAGSGSVTLYELPSILVSNTSGTVESYNFNGFSAHYRGESETVVNAVSNDNYYGFLYIAGNNGLYYSGNGTYAGNATSGSSTLMGVGNIIVSGQKLYVVQPSAITSPGVFSAGIAKESFNWTQNATMPSIQNNVNTAGGSNLFFTLKNSPNVYLCNNSSVSSTTSCNAEGTAIPQATTIHALAFTSLTATASSIPLTGLVAGANNGLWLESGSNVGSAANSWINAVTANAEPISGNIVTIVEDSNSNLYIADMNNNFYLLPVNGSNIVTPITGWTASVALVAPISNMVVDNAGNQIFISDAVGSLYHCEMPNGSTSASMATCTSSGQTGFGNSVASLNLVTALVN